MNPHVSPNTTPISSDEYFPKGSKITFSRAIVGLWSFQAANGHANVPGLHDNELGMWLVEIRQLKIAGELPEEKLKHFDGLRIAWDLRPAHDRFVDRFKRYSQTHNSKLISRTIDLNLHQLMTRHRDKWRLGQLPQEFVRQLDGLGFQWEHHRSDDSKVQFEAAQKFFEANPGKFPDSLNPEYSLLANWLRKQIRYKKANRLSQKLIERLEGIGFNWQSVTFVGVSDARWNDFVQFKALKGHCDVPQICLEFPALGHFAGMIRQAYKKGTISPYHAARLEGLGFRWAIHDFEKIWETSFQSLVEYKLKHGNCEVPNEYEPDQALGFWVVKQRSLYRHGKLSKERFDLLNDLGFAWVVQDFDTAWRAMFDKLLAYFIANGHSNVTAAEDPDLHRWAANQRQRRKDEYMANWQVRRLNEVAFVFAKYDSTNDWDARLSQLIEYKAKNGTTFVPKADKDFKVLGVWARRQVRNYREGVLTVERYKKLVEIGVSFKRMKVRRKKIKYPRVSKSAATVDMSSLQKAI